MSLPATINLASLDPSVGFRIAGLADLDYLGWSVSGLGDFNGDGLADFAAGARTLTDGGFTYVIFGREGGFPTGLGLADLDGSNGFTLPGYGSLLAGMSLDGIGDINGDGLTDLLIGAPFGTSAGTMFVVFGSDQPFDATLNLSALDGANGFRIDGVEANSATSFSVSAAGDFNGDGLADFIIASPTSDVGANDSGRAYLIYGDDAGFPATMSLNAVNGANGFVISGAASGNQLSFDLASLGDVNGDGRDDILLGALGGDGVYVIFGQDGVGANFNIGALNGTNGFKITGPGGGDRFGVAVSSAGDVNGDGLQDILIGAYGSNSAYVVFGRTTGFAANLNVSTLNGTDGFRITGANQSGREVGSAGDVNEDGYDDLLIGARVANSGAGTTYVVYGRATFSATVALSTLTQSTGVVINGAGNGDQSGLTVDGVGDINGDGIDDFLIGAQYADAGGNNNGAAYIIYGQPVELNFYGTSSSETANGGRLADLLIGAGGNDILRGRAGNDELFGGDGNDELYGEAGIDSLSGGAGDDLLDGGDGDDTLFDTAGSNILRGGAGIDSLVGGTGADRLDGGEDDDSLVGGAGSDYLDGGTGADSMSGGAGNDIYIVDDLGDTVSDAGVGSDRVRASVSFTLGSNLENLQLIGLGAINGTGNELANQLDGNSGDNTISGAGGADLIKGEDGADILNGDAGADQLLGGEGADTLNGGADNDLLNGGAGIDTLNGGEGADLLEGGLGDDILAGDAGSDQLYGGDGADTLRGGEGNDVLRGEAGLDSLFGGAGDDTYFIDADLDTVTEATGEGVDTVRATVSYTLGANVERLVLEGLGDLNGTGNALANVLTGNAGANRLEGLAGADNLNGGDGADVIVGGSGNDILTGGLGADRFIIGQESINLSSAPGTTVETDALTDLIAGQGDILDLSAIDAISGGADDAFQLVGAFNGQAGQMILSFAAGVTTLQLDIDGDARADYQIRITGDVRGDSGGWLL